jgi:hypothetical protein
MVVGALGFSAVISQSAINLQQNPQYPITAAYLFRGSEEIICSNRTAINPVKRWLYGDPGLAP